MYECVYVYILNLSWKSKEKHSSYIFSAHILLDFNINKGEVESKLRNTRPCDLNDCDKG